MCQPDDIYWCDGSEEERQRLTAMAVAHGELQPLNQDALPGCYLHRTAENDVARTEHLTYICTSFQGDAGPTNNWMSPRVAYHNASKIFAGSMKGRTMYVVPFAMGPVGSPFTKIGIELTDSVYVVLNMRIMTRMGEAVLDSLGPHGEFTQCLHSRADLDVQRRLILHFPEDNAIWSVGSGYGGNVLLGKKCLALRIASVIAQREKWLAEHMLILGIEEPNGHVQYVAAAFPSACGKTNLAMLLPPEGLTRKGYRIWTVGDDIAWLRIDTDGRLWAINPEMGFFGVVPGTNSKTNPNAVNTISHDTIYTNVALKPDGALWWEGHDDPAPAEAIDWRGQPWHPGTTGPDGKTILSSHPNSRFTAPFTNCPTHSFRYDEHHGVPISAIIFGGRRPTLSPLVHEALSWDHGVYLGATLASERTAAQIGVVGEIRRDPMAMLPFCGYNMADYPSAQNLQCQLVPHRRGRPFPLAGFRRESPHHRMDTRPLPRRGPRHSHAHRLCARSARHRHDRTGRGRQRDAETAGDQQRGLGRRVECHQRILRTIRPAHARRAVGAARSPAPTLVSRLAEAANSTRAGELNSIRQWQCSQAVRSDRCRSLSSFAAFTHWAWLQKPFTLRLGSGGNGRCNHPLPNSG